jgi:hypothetical protein
LAQYTFKVLNEQADIIETITHNCGSDLEAFEAAQKVSEGRSIEVWNGPRRLFRLKPQQKPPGPPVSRSD